MRCVGTLICCGVFLGSCTPSGKHSRSQAVKIAEPPPAAGAPAPKARPAATPAAPRWEPFAPEVLNPPAGEQPEDWVAAYQRGERRRFGAQPDVVLYFENPRACAELPAAVPAVYEITLIHTDREEVSSLPATLPEGLSARRATGGSPFRGKPGERSA